jgi:hypothetical protein
MKGHGAQETFNAIGLSFQNHGFSVGHSRLALYLIDNILS